MPVYHIQSAGAALLRRRRQQPTTTSPRRDNSSDNARNDILVVLAVVIGVFLCASLAAYFLLRSLRIRYSEPTYIPTTYLKRKWADWTPSSEKRKSFRSLPTDRAAALQRARSPSIADTLDILHRRPGMQDARGSATELSSRPTTNQGGDAAVDRHTSVRSIMTLPAYTASARPTEQILGREGERDGLDTVVAFPETVEEEETRRDEEMEGLYQIRRARREERDAREERRRLRAEAEARGDTQALEQLRRQRREQRQNAAMESSEALVQEHRTRDRGRRVSSVSYAELGVARHDGSRVRADSGDSDRRPLMDSAAQMGAGGGRHSGSRDGSRDASAVRARSGSSGFGAQQQHHLRTTSMSSLSRLMTPDVSDDDRSSMDFEIVPSIAGAGGRESRATSMSNTRPSFSTVPRLRVDSIDSNRPLPTSLATSTSTSGGRGGGGVSDGLPQYDELSPIADAHEPQSAASTVVARDHDELAPAYESPVRSDAPRIPAFSRLPAIRVTPFSPVAASALGSTSSSSPSGAGEVEWPAAAGAGASAGAIRR